MRRLVTSLAGSALLLILLLGTSNAHAQLSGALFTTDVTDSEVNANIYQSKDQVYLNGGPGAHAPLGAAGLPPGTYVFQVTDPSGKTLLSTDAPICRQFVVGSGGFITGVVAAGGCEHATGPDSVTGGKTVQLLPYLDTPNNGNEYKAWATPVENFICPLNTAPPTNCGFKAGSNVWGFIPSTSKTDNYKVKGTPLEIDTRFFDNSGAVLDGLGIAHIDTLGASNNKWSYYDASINVNHEAHVEDVEVGWHQIVLANQPGCTIGAVTLEGKVLPKAGPQTVSVHILNNTAGPTIRVDVSCQ